MYFDYFIKKRICKFSFGKRLTEIKHFLFSDSRAAGSSHTSCCSKYHYLVSGWQVPSLYQGRTFLLPSYLVLLGVIIICVLFIFCIFETVQYLRALTVLLKASIPLHNRRFPSSGKIILLLPVRF